MAHPRILFLIAVLLVAGIGVGAARAEGPCAEADEACWLKALSGEDAPAALRATMALGELKSAAAIEPLIEKLSSSDNYAATAAVYALVKIGDPAVPALAEASESKSPGVRKYAGYALSKIGGGTAFQAVSRLAKDDSAEIRIQAAQAFARLKDKRSLLDLVMLLQDRDRKVRVAALGAIGQMPDIKTAKPVIDFGLADLDNEVSQDAASVLLLIGPNAIDPLMDSFDGAPEYVQRRSALVMGQLAVQAAPPTQTRVRKRLHILLKDTHAKWETRRAVCVAITPIADKQTVAILEDLVAKNQDKTEAAELVQAAKNALQQIPKTEP